MPITGWINFTKNDHLRVASVLDMLSEAGSVDELGIGTIRDSLADALFPGISTIQTRPKYFFIVANIIKDFIEGNNEKAINRTSSEYLSDREDDIMRLLNSSGKYHEGDGIIGISLTRPNETLSRRPSEIYWNGLRTFNFINTSHSRSQYLKLLNKGLLILNKKTATSGDDQDDPENDYTSFGIKLGHTYDQDWSENLEIELSKKEAIFFLQRLKDQNNTLLKVFASHPDVFEDFINPKLKINSKNNFTLGVHSILINHQDKIPELVKNNLKLAVNFSSILLGANIAYNYQIQIIKNGSSIDFYRDQWEYFINNYKENMIDPEAFKLDELFHIAKTTKEVTRRFLREYYSEIQSEKPQLEKVIELVKSQERFLKRKRARLTNGQLAEIDANFTYGLAELNYRFNTVNRLFTDIFISKSNA